MCSTPDFKSGMFEGRRLRQMNNDLRISQVNNLLMNIYWYICIQSPQTKSGLCCAWRTHHKIPEARRLLSSPGGLPLLEKRSSHSSQCPHGGASPVWDGKGLPQLKGEGTKTLWLGLPHQHWAEEEPSSSSGLAGRLAVAQEPNLLPARSVW